MTIKHSISKIAWAIKWALNYYIAQSSQKSSSWVAASWRRDVVGKATSGRRGLWALMSWGPEKMLIRCRKESHQPAEWPLGFRLSIKRTRKTQHDGHNSGVKILQFMFGLQLLLTVKPHTTFRTLQIKWEVYICKEVLPASLSLRRYVSSIYICIFLHESADDNITMVATPKLKSQPALLFTNSWKENS